MPPVFYFQITLEPHLKRSGLVTGRKILFLAEVPVAAAKAASEAPDEDQAVHDAAKNLAANLTCLAMTGKPHQPGEDDMRISFDSTSPTSKNISQRRPDAERDGVRIWLLGAHPE